MLQGCGNDLRMSGARYIPGFGFRFVPEELVADAPPQTAAQPTPPAGEEAAEITEVRLIDAITGARSAPDSPPATAATAAADEGEKEFVFKPAAKTRPNLVEFKGFESFEVGVKDGKTTVRFS